MPGTGKRAHISATACAAFFCTAASSIWLITSITSAAILFISSLPKPRVVTAGVPKRMPLVMRMPGGVAAHIVDTPVELFDIMATILELAGVVAEHTHFAKSLVPQLSGARGDEERAAFAQGGYDPHQPHCFEGRSVGTYAQRGPDNIYYQKGLLQQTHPASVCRAVMIRTATHKLIYRTSDTCELYHMRADPRELENLYGCPEAAELQRKLERRLLDFYLHTSDVTPREEDPRGLPEGGFRAASLAAGRQDFSAERR